jgi:hypothetical protein
MPFPSECIARVILYSVWSVASCCQDKKNEIVGNKFLRVLDKNIHFLDENNKCRVRVSERFSHTEINFCTSALLQHKEWKSDVVPGASLEALGP